MCIRYGTTRPGDQPLLPSSGFGVRMVRSESGLPEGWYLDVARTVVMIYYTTNSVPTVNITIIMTTHSLLIHPFPTCRPTMKPLADTAYKSGQG